MVHGLVVEVLLGNSLLDNLLQELLLHLIRLDVLGVLRANDNSIHTARNDCTVVVLVFHSDLGLGVRSQPGEGAIPTSIAHGLVELVCQLDGQRQVLRSLISGIAKHDTLVTSAQLLQRLLVVQTLCDIWTLLFNGNKDVAGLVVETLLRGVVADVLDGITDDLLVVQPRLGGNFAKDHDHAGLGGSLAGDFGERVLLEAGIEHGIGDLICDLVWMTFTDGLGGEAARVEESETNPRIEVSTTAIETHRKVLPVFAWGTPLVVTMLTDFLDRFVDRDRRLVHYLCVVVGDCVMSWGTIGRMSEDGGKVLQAQVVRCFVDAG
jgi:hypothetical protein